LARRPAVGPFLLGFLEKRGKQPERERRKKGGWNVKKKEKARRRLLL